MSEGIKKSELVELITPFTGDISANNLSGTNTGDETDSTIKTKLGITTLSGF